MGTPRYTLASVLGLALTCRALAAGEAVEADAFGKVLPAKTAAEPADPKQTTAGDFYLEPSTLHCLGFEWNIRGDENRNGRVAIRYRRVGEPNWREAMDLLRIKGEQVATSNPKWAYTCGNLYAGSILFLEPGTKYEVRLALSDPDNGPTPVAEQHLVVPTKSEPKPFDGGRRLHVYPPDHKGAKQEPTFADLAAAYAKAEPGDQVLLHAGTYGGSFTLSKVAARDKPIVLRDAGDGEVVFQGNPNGKVTREPIKGTDQFHWHENANCLDVSGAAYLWIEGLAFRHYDFAIHCGDQGTTRGLTVRHCRFEDNGWSAVIIRSVAARDVWIADCVFRGTQGTWHRDEAKPFPYKAVWAVGQGTDVCYNLAQNHKDGLSIFQGASLPPSDKFERFETKISAVDFHHNDVGQSSDDNEADGGQHNVRFFCNRFVDQHVGLSAQPFYGGPCYFVRNVQYNVTRGVVFKLNVEPAGVLILHNTSVSYGKLNDTGVAIITPGTNVHVHNNLFLGIAGPTLKAGVLEAATSTWDHNGYTVVGPVQFRVQGGPAAKSFEEMQQKFGYEKHWVQVAFDDLASVPPPPGEAKTHHDLNFGDARLRQGSKAIDAGMLIPNVTDGFTGKAPDLGAYELGQPVPHYGPRPR